MLSVWASKLEGLQTPTMTFSLSLGFAPSDRHSFFKPVGDPFKVSSVWAKQVEQGTGTVDDLFTLTDVTDQLQGQLFTSGWFDAKTSSTSYSLTQWWAPQTVGMCSAFISLAQWSAPEPMVYGHWRSCWYRSSRV